MHVRLIYYRCTPGAYKNAFPSIILFQKVDGNQLLCQSQETTDSPDKTRGCKSGQADHVTNPTAFHHCNHQQFLQVDVCWYVTFPVLETKETVRVHVQDQRWA